MLILRRGSRGQLRAPYKTYKRGRPQGIPATWSKGWRECSRPVVRSGERRDSREAVLLAFAVATVPFERRFAECRTPVMKPPPRSFPPNPIEFYRTSDPSSIRRPLALTRSAVEKPSVKRIYTSSSRSRASEGRPLSRHSRAKLVAARSSHDNAF